MIVYKKRFFHDPWRIFDIVVVSIALLPATGAFAVLRALRVLRVLRMISTVTALRRVVTGLLKAVPGLGPSCQEIRKIESIADSAANANVAGYRYRSCALCRAVH